MKCGAKQTSVKHIQHCTGNSVVCLKCGRKYANKAALLQHNKRAHRLFLNLLRPRVLLCGMCPAMFSSNYQRLKHRRENHGLKFPMSYCLKCDRIVPHTHHAACRQKPKPSTAVVQYNVGLNIATPRRQRHAEDANIIIADGFYGNTFVRTYAQWKELLVNPPLPVDDYTQALLLAIDNFRRDEEQYYGVRVIVHGQ